MAAKHDNVKGRLLQSILISTTGFATLFSVLINIINKKSPAARMKGAKTVFLKAERPYMDITIDMTKRMFPA